MQCKHQNILKHLLLIGLIYFPIFGFLDTFPLRIWDESRLAINAYEMTKNNNFFVTFYEGHPDLWNTKPPLLIWFQALFMKLFGVNELSVRLPSAIAAFLMCYGIILFSLKYLKSFLFSFIVILILITSQGFIVFHSVRAGDYDSLLTLFTTLSSLSFFAYCETKNYKFIYLFFGVLTLAILTKSVAGLLFTPALFLYALYRKRVISLLKSKHFYIALLSLLLILTSYYWGREMISPGYLNAVYENELGGRYLKVLELHQHGFFYYYNNLIHGKYSPWYWLIPCGVVIGLISKHEKIKRLTIFSSIMVLIYFLIISYGKTKLKWYDLPLYPFMSIISGVCIYSIYLFLKKLDLKKPLLSNLSPFIFLILVFVIPYQKIIAKTYKPREESWDVSFYELGYFLQDAVKGKYDLSHNYLLYDGYRAHNLFYLNVLNDNGCNIAFKNWKNLEKGDEVIAVQKNVIDYIDSNYTYKTISTINNVVRLKINGRIK